MGDPKKARRQYETPKKLWEHKRIEEDKGLREEFGLKNSRELWRMDTMMRKIRREARRLLSKKGKNISERTERVLKRVRSFLLNNPTCTLDDVLTLGVRDILARRLQSIVFKKRLAQTMRQARQLVVHGHIAVNGKRVSSPSYLAKFVEESAVDWFGKPIAGSVPAPGAAAAAARLKEAKPVNEAAEPKEAKAEKNAKDESKGAKKEAK
ncbi:MAG: 30S ribosomal protein S4 [Candidatus Micrarchaeota archaeon]